MAASAVILLYTDYCGCPSGYYCLFIFTPV